MAMRCRFAVLAVTLGLALSLPAQAQNTGSAAAMSPALGEVHKAACDELAAIVLPETQVEPQTDRMVEQMLTQLFKQDSGIRDLETAYPGMRDALGAGMKPVLVELAFKLMPSYRADLSALYQDNLTTGEARIAAAFFRSPPMVKFVSSARANMNYEASLGNLDPDKPATAADLQSDLHAAGASSINSVSPAELKAIGVFMASPIGTKLRALGAQKLSIDAKWMNYTDPQSDKAITSAVEQAIIAHIALSDPETAALMREELAKPEK
jgi:hypothetical protein